MKTALRMLTYLICSPLIVYGILILVTALIGRLLGGPREPPSGMAWEEFKEWTDSGRWFWESMLQGIGWTILPMLAIWGVNRGTRK